MKIRLRKTDKLFTKILRIKQDFTCQRCKMKYVFEGVRVRSLGNLGVSHYFSRRKESTRFDEENCDLLCNIPCHQLWGHGEERAEYTKFMIKKLGQKGLDLLELRAHTYTKRDDIKAELILKEELKEMLKEL